MGNSIRHHLNHKTIGIVASIVLVLTSFVSASTAEPPWLHPLKAATLIRPFQAPLHEYGPGHRGADYSATTKSEIVAPADGIIFFSGMVAGREVITVAIDDKWLLSFEPVSEALATGSVVSAGDVIALVGEDSRERGSLGFHAPGIVHIGARLDGEYLNPELLFKQRRYPILLPCCENN